MRCIMALGACFSAALATAACNLITTDQRYVREGAGTDVYWSGLSDATYLQELYVGYICQQGGLSVTVQGDGPRCNDVTFGPREWGVFVQAGMNDIDKRCNAYLAWMDEKKRSSGPILQEIADINAATSAILIATGVGVVPIGITAAAFGLATNTFTNLNHRLVLELEKTTVQAVVFNGRNTYRLNLKTVTIDNRPAAIHALQSYLEICTPVSIEANVNTTITVFERGGPGAAQALTNNRLNTTKTVAAAGPAVRVRSTAVSDDAGVALTKYLYPNGVLATRDPDHAKVISDFLKEQKINAPISFFLDSSMYAPDRLVLARRLKLVQ